MELNIKVDASEHLKIFVNGKFAAEIAVKEVLALENLVGEVREARALKTLAKVLPKYLKEMPTRKDTGEAALGFIDGLRRATIPHPSGGVPPIRPNYNKDYSLGYDFGEFLMNVGNCLTNSLSNP